MNKLDLAVRLARQLHRSQAKAADDVDKLVYDILSTPKRSKDNTAKKNSAGKRGPVPKGKR